MPRIPMDDADRMVAMIERAREARGISVAELSRRVGIGRKRLWCVLNGRRAMRVDEFVKLCVFFGMGIGAFASARSARSGDSDASPERRPDGSPAPSFRLATRHAASLARRVGVSCRRRKKHDPVG